jgi:hypothetical protein
VRGQTLELAVLVDLSTNRSNGKSHSTGRCQVLALHRLGKSLDLAKGGGAPSTEPFAFDGKSGQGVNNFEDVFGSNSFLGSCRGSDTRWRPAVLARIERAKEKGASPVHTGYL